MRIDLTLNSPGKLFAIKQKQQQKQVKPETDPYTVKYSKLLGFVLLDRWISGAFFFFFFRSRQYLVGAYQIYGVYWIVHQIFSKLI